MKGNINAMVEMSQVLVCLSYLQLRKKLNYNYKSVKMMILISLLSLKIAELYAETWLRAPGVNYG